MDPFDRGAFTALADEVHGELADGREGVVVDLAPLDDGDLLVEQREELAHDTGFGLSPQSEQDDVVLGKYGVDQCGNHAVFVADDPGEQGLLLPHLPDKVLPDLVLHRDDLIAAPPQLAQRLWLVHGLTFLLPP